MLNYNLPIISSGLSASGGFSRLGPLKKEKSLILFNKTTRKRAQPINIQKERVIMP
jgi:hypothetical protein